MNENEIHTADCAMFMHIISVASSDYYFLPGENTVNKGYIRGLVLLCGPAAFCSCLEYVGEM